MLGNFLSEEAWRLRILCEKRQGKAVWEGMRAQISAQMMPLLILEGCINRALAEELQICVSMYFFRAFRFKNHLLGDNSKLCFLPARAEVRAENPSEQTKLNGFCVDNILMCIINIFVYLTFFPCSFRNPRFPRKHQVL